MDKKEIEGLRNFYEVAYRKEDTTVVVVASEISEIDATIEEYQEKGYMLYDSNRFGTMGDGAIGEFLVFVKKKGNEEEND